MQMAAPGPRAAALVHSNVPRRTTTRNPTRCGAIAHSSALCRHRIAHTAPLMPMSRTRTGKRRQLRQMLRNGAEPRAIRAHSYVRAFAFEPELIVRLFAYSYGVQRGECSFGSSRVELCAQKGRGRVSIRSGRAPKITTVLYSNCRAAALRGAIAPSAFSKCSCNRSVA